MGIILQRSYRTPILSHRFSAIPAGSLETSEGAGTRPSDDGGSTTARRMESILPRRSGSEVGDECDGVSGSRLGCHNARASFDRLPLLQCRRRQMILRRSAADVTR